MVPGAYGAGVSVIGGGLVAAMPDATWIGWTFVGIGALIVIWGIRVHEKHLWQLGWLTRHVWWRFGRRPSEAPSTRYPEELEAILDSSLAADGGVDLPKLRDGIDRCTDPNREFNDEGERLRQQDEAKRACVLEPLPRPDFAGAPECYPYAFPKALVTLEVLDAKGQREQAAGADKPEATKARIRIVSKHNKPLMGCYAIVRTIRQGGRAEQLDLSLRINKGQPFRLEAGSPALGYLVRRDISDKVTPEPFLLLLNEREYVLADNSQYLLEIELGTAFPYPVLSTLQIDTGKGLDLRLAVVSEQLMDSGAG
jgi:hypothetical protein